jgi:hypothetical protein
VPPACTEAVIEIGPEAPDELRFQRSRTQSGPALATPHLLIALAFLLLLTQLLVELIEERTNARQVRAVPGRCAQQVQDLPGRCLDPLIAGQGSPGLARTALTFLVLSHVRFRLWHTSRAEGDLAHSS